MNRPRPSPRRHALRFAALVALLVGAPASAQVCGDCDSNGVVNVLDAFAGASHAVGLLVLAGPAHDSCDVDSTGAVNVLDAVTIAHISAGYPRTINCPSSLAFAITEVTFDHSAGATTDAHGLRRSYTVDVMVPEWLPGSGRNEPALLIGGTTPRVRFRLSVTPATVTSATVWATTGGSVIGDFSEVPVTFVGGLSPVIEMPLANPVPVALGKHAITFTWSARDVQGYGPSTRPVGTSGPHTIYTTPGAPATPWAASGTREPWTKALDYVTTWSGGAASPEATLDGMMPTWRTAYGMQYDTVSGAPGYSVGFGWDFNLTLLLNRMDTSTVGIYCCYDPARALATFANLVGGNMRFWFMNSSGGFFVNCINLNGRGWTNSPFYDADGSPMIRPPDMGSPRWAFGNHAFTGPYGPVGPPTYVWDGTCSGDNDGNADEPPFTEINLSNLPWATFSAIEVDTNPARTTFTPTVNSFNIQ